MRDLIEMDEHLTWLEKWEVRFTALLFPAIFSSTITFGAAVLFGWWQ